MFKLPKVPEKEELEYKEREFLLSAAEQFAASKRVWFYIFAVVLVIAVPTKFFLQNYLTKALIASYVPPRVNLVPYSALDIEVLKAEILPVDDQKFSIYAQIFNPNLKLSAPKFNYKFILKDRSGKLLSELLGQSYLLAGETKFLIFPSFQSPIRPASVELAIDQFRWTQRSLEVSPQINVIQKNTGVTAEGNFFVEGLVKNLNSFILRKVDLGIAVYNSSNEIIGVNATLLTDLKPFESRYFRTLWPNVFPDGVGLVEVPVYFNPLAGNVILEEPLPVPVR